MHTFLGGLAWWILFGRSLIVFLLWKVALSVDDKFKFMPVFGAWVSLCGLVLEKVFVTHRSFRVQSWSKCCPFLFVLPIANWLVAIHAHCQLWHWSRSEALTALSGRFSRWLSEIGHRKHLWFLEGRTRLEHMQLLIWCSVVFNHSERILSVATRFYHVHQCILSGKTKAIFPSFLRNLWKWCFSHTVCQILPSMSLGVQQFQYLALVVWYLSPLSCGHHLSTGCCQVDRWS